MMHGQTNIEGQILPSSLNEVSLCGLASRLRDELSGVRILEEARNFSPKHPDKFLGPPHPLFYRYGGSFLKIKAAGT
jgi:hypothetical protein